VRGPTSRKRLLQAVFPDEFLGRLNPGKSDVHRHLHRIFIDVDEWSLQQQEFHGSLLELAERYGQLVDDTVMRLRSPNYVTFWGKLHELVVAQKFDVAGVSLDFSAPGPRGHEGEFVANLREPLFVEVKTMFPHERDEVEMRYLDRLCRVAEEVEFPAWIMIALLAIPKSYPSLKPFKDFLIRELPRLAAQPRRRNYSLYEDPVTGLKVRVAFQIRLTESPVSASPWSGLKPLTEDASARASLKRAYSQLPGDKSCLVVLCNRLQFPPSPRLLRDALYGSTQWRVHTADLMSGAKTLPVELTRKDDGFFARCLRRKLSAVGILDELGEKYNPKAELVIHHHPCPDKPIDASALEPVTRRQELAERVQLTARRKILVLTRPFDPPWPKEDSQESD